jgi:hypothetical protein
MIEHCNVNKLQQCGEQRPAAAASRTPCPRPILLIAMWPGLVRQGPDNGTPSQQGTPCNSHPLAP